MYVLLENCHILYRLWLGHITTTDLIRSPNYSQEKKMYKKVTVEICYLEHVHEVLILGVLR